MKLCDTGRMSRLQWIMLTVLIVLIQTVSQGAAQGNVPECPRYCSCNRNERGVAVNCNYQRLSDMQSITFPPDTFYLDFSFNALTEINRNTVPNLPQLLVLKIENCQVTNIDADSFAHLENLQNLTLNGNQIRDIHRDAFRGLISLRHLSIEKNNIVQLEGGVFDSLELETLYLTENNIQQMTADTFQGLLVSELHLGGNMLSRLTGEILQPISSTLTVFTLENNETPLTIDINTFQNTNLELLDLRNSSLTEHGFLKFIAVKSLDISRNAFNNLDFTPYGGLSRVQEVKLSKVGIEFLDEKLLGAFQNLKKLDLSENKLVVVSGNAFRSVPSLTELYLTANPIAQLADNFGDNLSNLEKLGMRGCRLSELVNPKPFQPMINLKWLDLGNNLIQVVGPDMQDILNRLDSLILDGNRFHCNCEIRWFFDWMLQTNRNMRYIVQGLDNCVTPHLMYIWGVPKEEMVCQDPTITHIIASTELVTGEHASGNGETLDVPEGATIMLQCTGHGDPAPTLRWDFPFQSADEISVEPDTNRTVQRTTSHYQLTRVRADQSGRYKCIATNLQSVTEAYIQINVRSDLTMPHTPGPLPTRSDEDRSLPDKTKAPGKPTTTTTTPSGGPAVGSQKKEDDSSDSNTVRNSLIGVGVSIVVITLIVLIVVIVYIYKARQRALQKTYNVQERLGGLKYSGALEGSTNTAAMEGMESIGNGDPPVANGHTGISRLDSEMSTTSTTPFGLSHA